MFEQQPETLREKVKLLATESVSKSDPSGWFDVLYAQANGDATQVPWARMTTHPYLQDWLDKYPPAGEGKSALVIGCGLGDDAEALATCGFEVTGFDISPKAIAWCNQRFPNSRVTYQVADLFALDQNWVGAFDLVYECRNIQALPLNVRAEAIKCVGELVAAGGKLLVVTRFRDTDTPPDGPPWPLSETELAQFQQLGLQEIKRDTFFEGENNEVKQVRVEYVKG
ncbi:MAG: class I SAM-dependent methyltransferase [Gomphosphaeria aponina SAG 52.96 = DSM 107014]|uniref:Class I SAM-dependent methyltransferase n=1 Tax=Gomphosphaeria aponina SAG 52.96 = DSM 107014 TaxID=1521640 RepID=A0A941GMW1_9CHRO|nr:class I SAM-dependent methyltransferase [Gomphosphaeria aponina SAG 52.96 = DSM 107014]